MTTIDAGIASIPSNYSRLIARELGLQAQDVSDLLAMTGLSVDQFLREDTLLTPQQQLQILQNSLGIANDAAFGFRIGRRLTSPTHGAMGFLVNSSPDLHTALRAFQEFLPTRMSLARLELETRGDWLEVTCGFDRVHGEELHRVLSEIAVTIFFESAEFIVGRPVEEAVSCFVHQRPVYGDRYADHIPGAVEFGAEAFRLRIPLAVCRIPNASANDENYRMALQQCQAMLAQLHPDQKTCTYQVKRMLLSRPPGTLSEEEAAAMLFVCKRTLARKLKREGSSFRQLRNEILSQQAIGYLRDGTMSIEAMAEMLNYHDSANFRRAFKKWFNVTPDEYRRHNLS